MKVERVTTLKRQATRVLADLTSKHRVGPSQHIETTRKQGQIYQQIRPIARLSRSKLGRKMEDEVPGKTRYRDLTT